MKTRIKIIIIGIVVASILFGTYQSIMYQCGTLPVFMETPRTPTLLKCLDIWKHQSEQTQPQSILSDPTMPNCNNGTIIPSYNDAKIIPVLTMQPDSTGTICITYNFPYDWESYPNKDWYPDHKFHFDLINIDSEHFTITANPEWIDTKTISAGDNVTVIYKIHADSNSQGLYDTVIPYGNCQRYPFAVGYDESEIIPSDFPNASMTPPCVFVFSGEKQVTIVSGMDYFELD